MISTATENPTVVRTERGLTVKGTRLTLYDIMDSVVAGYPRDLILSFYPSLTEEELDDILNYIETNREEFEVEYQRVLKRAEETECYWRERNRERESRFDPNTLSPERRALWDKLQAWKEQIRSREERRRLARAENGGVTVVRRDGSLYINGTRIMLYDVMDYLHAGWPPKLTGDMLNLELEQMADVMAYINEHKEEVEAEYQHVLKRAEEIERCWEERNRDRVKPIDPDTLSPERRALWEKLEAWKERLGQL